MSLRYEIRDALDQVAPAPAQLEKRVIEFVFQPARRRITRSGRSTRYVRTSRFKGLYAIAAVVLIVAMAGGLMLGGRLLRELSRPPSNINASLLRDLEARPWRIPSVASTATCPQTAGARYVPEFPMLVVGRGPFFYAGGQFFGKGEWASWGEMQFAYPFSRPLEGPILLRARNLVTGAVAVFASSPLGPSDLQPAGQALGEDHTNGRTLLARTEAVTQPPFKTNISGQTPNLRVLTGFAGSSGCIGYQLDGPAGVSDEIVILYD